MKKRGTVAIALSCFAAVGLFALPSGTKDAQAGRAPAYCEGVAASEIILLSGNAQVEVEREKLVFHAEKLPDAASIGDYGGTVNAEYTLYNPSAADETLRLAIPLGRADNGYFEAGEQPNGHGVTLNGEGVQTRLRHNFLSYTDLPAKDDLLSRSDCFGEGATVREYVFAASLPEGYSAENVPVLQLELHYNAEKTCVFAPGLRSYDIRNGSARFTFGLGNGVTACSVFCVGEEASILSACVRDADEGAELGGAQIIRQEKPVRTFSEYAGASPYEEVTNEDWVLACGNYLQSRMPYADTPVYGELYRFAEYEITVPAGQRVAHAVQAPLLPDLRSSTCYYTYNFDGAFGWAEYHALEIEVHAGSAPQHSTLEFVAGEGVYTHGRSNVPMRALRFSLGGEGEDAWRNDTPEDIVVALIILALLAVAAAVVIVVITLRRRRRRALLKERENARPDIERKQAAEAEMPQEDGEEENKK